MKCGVFFFFSCGHGIARNSGRFPGVCRRGVPRAGSRDHEHAELARPRLFNLLPPCWQLPMNANKYKTDFVFGIFWSRGSKNCIKASLWGWLSTEENQAEDPDQSIPEGLPLECHVLA